MGRQRAGSAPFLSFGGESSNRRSARGQPETIEEQRLTGKSGGAVVFSVEDALAAETELQEWRNDRLQSCAG